MSRETKAQPRSPLTKPQLEAFTEALRALYWRYADGAESLANAAQIPQDSSASPSHLGDVGSDICEQDMSINLLEGRQDVLQDIQRALANMVNGTYGMCEDCREPISIARLEALPHASLCVPCQLRSENPL